MNWTGSSDGNSSGPAAAGSAGAESAGGIELVAVSDPVEGGFTVWLPRGWQNQAHSVRPYGVHRAVIASLSPDGGTWLFVGDPQMPDFMEPNPQMFGFPMGGPMSHVQPYVPAEPFFLHYVGQRFGQAGRDFRVTAAAPCPALVQSFRAEATRRGMQVHATAVSLSFAFADNRGMKVSGRLHGATVSFGQTWVVSLFGLTTTGPGDPARWDDLLFQVSQSYATNPQWRQRQDQLHAQAMGQIQLDHQAAMQQMQASHQSNMQWIQNSAQGHQARMDALHAAGDAQMQGWQAQQAASDAGHRNFMNAVNEQSTVGHGGAAGGDAGGGGFSHQRFVNYINEQETVIDPNGGDAYQVEAGHQRYYKHKRDDTYVGTDNFTELDDLRKRGLNPDDYDEVKIRR